MKRANERAQHPTLRVRLLGATQISYGDRRLDQYLTPRTLLLLAALIKHQGEPLSREQLAFTLWPDHNEDEARANLRRHLYQLARVLPPQEAPWVVSDAKTVSWPARHDAWADVAEFERLSEANEPEAALALYRGELLPRIDHEWVAAARAALHGMACRHLERAIVQRRERGDLTTCLEHVEHLLALDPWREDMLRALMYLRFRKGDRAGALAAYRDFCRRLRFEFDVDPMPQTERCHELIARGQAALEECFPGGAAAALGIGA
ncbi:MAG: AfsR/SARP family transcriptional regulator [Vulcanimicrobiaceae bacterium]